MGSALPVGDPVPADGRIADVAAPRADTDFGVYIHIPFCTVRCGYCDFNTYTADELRGVHRSDYRGDVLTEIEMAGPILEETGIARPASTVFFGGGTPTLLPARDLVEMISEVAHTFGIRDGAEVTVEANPDTVTPELLTTLRDGGVTRVSLGMQSAVPHVLSTLDRTHDPASVPYAVNAARDAGLGVSVDLIYGAPGESLDDWRRSVDAAVALGPDHISAYALIVEEGTKLARQIRRGEVAAPDDDLQADMYELADAAFAAAGYAWYEISNWSRSQGARSRHNLSYWSGADWWGFGPGAHSHVGGVRWWNVRHPAAYADRVRAGTSPAHAREVLSDRAREWERILLGTRIADGMPTHELPESARQKIAGLIADGLIDGADAVRGRLVLTLRGRLLADTVARALTE